MSSQHVFKLKLPNGLEVEIQGDKDFVSGGYGDIKAAATELFNREAGRSSKEAAFDKLLGEPRPTPEVVVPVQTTPAALLAEGAQQPAVQTVNQSTSGKGKKRQYKKKTDSAQAQLATVRQAQLDQIVQAPTFEDFDRYSAAINKKEATLLDLAALMARLAQTKFGIAEGLAPSEVLYILKNRFFINRTRRPMEIAMKRAPSTFFSVGPAAFDHRAKLYRPMKDCIDRVDALLNEFNDARLDSTDAGATNITGAAVN